MVKIYTIIHTISINFNFFEDTFCFFKRCFMSKVSYNKMRILKLMDIFNEFTDEEHGLTAQELCKKLEKFGIICERKSVYKDIETLISYGLDINLSKKNNGGYYLDNRQFELPEILLLVEIVRNSQFITQKKSKILILKLKKLLSKNQARLINENDFNNKFVKNKNEDIYYNIDCINNAILNNKKIKFKYYEPILRYNNFFYEKKGEFIMQVQKIVQENEKFFLLGILENDKKIKKFRIDRIKKTEIINNGEIFKIKEKNTYINLQLVCEKNALGNIVDLFKFYNLKEINKEKFQVEIKTRLDPELINWLVINGKKIYVESPVFLRRIIIKIVQDIYNNYINF